MSCNGSMWCENCGGVCAVDQGIDDEYERHCREEIDRQYNEDMARKYSEWAERMLEALGETTGKEGGRCRHGVLLQDQRPCGSCDRGEP